MYQTYQNGNQDEVIKTIKKRRNIYAVIWAVLLVITGVSGVISWYLSIAALVLCGIAARLAIFCINTVRYIQTDGRKRGGGLFWWVLFIFGFIIMPIITVQLCARIEKLGSIVIGA